MDAMKRSPGVSFTDPGQRPASAAAFDGITAEQMPRLILESADLGEFLEAFATLAAGHFAADGSEVGCGITVVSGRRPATSGFSDDRARLLGQPQLSAWGAPEHAQAALMHGAESVAFAPLDLFPDLGSGLLLHSTRAGDFNGPVLHTIEEFARRAEPSLRLAVRFFGLVGTTRDLRAALQSRTVIDQALGIIMGQNRCSQHEAFTILRTASARTNTKLRDLAAQIVGSVGERAPTTHFDN